MRSLIFLLASFIFLSGCESSSSNTSLDEDDLRVAFVSFSLGMTHNSHLNRNYSTPETAFSATITFEVFLTEETDHMNIIQFAIQDEQSNGWIFDSNEIQAAYNEENNSLIFSDLQLRQFDSINNRLISAQILDENGELIRERAFNLDNDFPLPALTAFEQQGEDYLLTVDFYSTPYDGGSIPFNVTIYNTYFTSYFSIVWLDSNNSRIREDYIDKETMNEVSNGTWTLNLTSDSIPSNAESMYTVFRRGGFTSGGVLYTRIIPLP